VSRKDLAGFAPTVLVLALSGCGVASPSATPEPSTVASAASPSPTTSPPSSTWPTIEPSSANVPAQLDLATIGFWTLEQPIAAVDLSLNTLRIGTLDGLVTRTVELHNPGNGPLHLSLQPQPVGPAGGRVLYVADDGHQATLHAVTAGSGADTELLTTSSFIVTLALDPARSTAYAVMLDRVSGAFLSVDGVPTAGGKVRSLIASEDLGPDSATSCTPVSGLGYYPRLAVSTDGRWVVIASFRPSGCGLVAAPTDGGSLRTWPEFAIDEQIVGIAGDLLIGWSTCADAQCDGFVIDLGTGDRQPLGGAAGSFTPRQLIAGPHGLLVLRNAGDYEKGEWQVESLDLTDRTRTTVFAGTFKPAYTVVGLAEFHQAELPPGWFLIYRNADAAPNPYPDYSAGTLGGAAELPLPIMSFPKP
jgi:hypothetical protein